MDEHDFHHVGLTDEFLADFLLKAGFCEVYRAHLNLSPLLPIFEMDHNVIA